MDDALVRAGRALRLVVLIVLAVLFMIPFYLLVRNGLSSEQDITSPEWTLFPSELHWDNVRELFEDPSVPFARSLLNSALIAVATLTWQRTREGDAAPRPLVGKAVQQLVWVLVLASVLLIAAASDSRLPSASRRRRRSASTSRCMSSTRACAASTTSSARPSASWISRVASLAAPERRSSAARWAFTSTTFMLVSRF